MKKNELLSVSAWSLRCYLLIVFRVWIRLNVSTAIFLIRTRKWRKKGATITFLTSLTPSAKLFWAPSFFAVVEAYCLSFQLSSAVSFFSFLLPFVFLVLLLMISKIISSRSSVIPTTSPPRYIHVIMIMNTYSLLFYLSVSHFCCLIYWFQANNGVLELQSNSVQKVEFRVPVRKHLMYQIQFWSLFVLILQIWVLSFMWIFILFCFSLFFFFIFVLRLSTRIRWNTFFDCDYWNDDISGRWWEFRSRLVEYASIGVLC